MEEKYMVIKHVALDTVCGITSTLPENQVPEIAFAGAAALRMGAEIG